jgi:hypothetical protein
MSGFIFSYFFNQHGSEKVVVTEQRARSGLEGIVCELMNYYLRLWQLNLPQAIYISFVTLTT